MKKIYLSLFMAVGVMGTAIGQQSAGGFPASMDMTVVQDQEVALLKLPKPDFASIKKQNAMNEADGVPGPYRVATMVPMDVNLTNSGSWTYLEDGRKIWRLSVSVSDAKALGFLYDQFYLPKGVRLFISNENGRQILGAYTSANNSEEYRSFVSEPIQGAVANFEMDVPAGVAVKDIEFHVFKSSAYYRGVNDLEYNFGSDAEGTTPAKPTGTGLGSSAPCNIDANCSLPSYVEEDYSIPKRASVRISINDSTSSGYCSGTLINNTGNSENGTCTPYVLTASHCDEGNSYQDSHFQYWQFRFNFRKEVCDSAALEGYGTLNGAFFKARSHFPSIGTFDPNNPNQTLQLVGDFLLLQLKQTPPTSYATYLAGWNRSLDVVQDINTYYFFIGYHYPHGDVEKMSYAGLVQANGTFNQNQVPATHWYIAFSDGGTQPGSSGSGLFDVYGRLIGDLSGGSNSGCQGIADFDDFGKEGLYSKLSYAWDNDFDQTTFPAHAGAQSRLKDWLDPTNSGATSIGPVTPDCVPTGIRQLGDELGNSIQVYPTPSSSGIIHAKTNLSVPTDLQVNIYSAVGRLVKSFAISGAYNGEYSFNCADLANGLYLMKFVGKNAVATKKVLIAR